MYYTNDILFQGAEELNRAVKSMKDTNSLLPQLRTFLTFLDSTLEAETNFKVMHFKYLRPVEIFCINAFYNYTDTRISMIFTDNFVST